MGWNITVGATDIRVAYIAIVAYILFTFIALFIVWSCFKEKAGITRMKEIGVVDGDNYDASAFNVDVNISIHNNGGHKLEVNTEKTDLSNRIHFKREKTVEMVNLEPERMKSHNPTNNFDEYDEENMFNDINLANNPSSNDINISQQLKIESNTNLNLNNSAEVNKQPSYHGNAVRLEDLPNFIEDEYDHKTNSGHTHNESVQTLAIQPSMNSHKKKGYINMVDTSINFQNSPSIDIKKFGVTRNCAES